MSRFSPALRMYTAWARPPRAGACRPTSRAKGESRVHPPVCAALDHPVLGRRERNRCAASPTARCRVRTCPATARCGTHARHPGTAPQLITTT